MKLFPDLLFHSRYRLVQRLGEGASASVWLAQDTMAGNLKVALKIFSHNEDMDSIGLQNFQREFTSVYNMKHSNLLPPTGYNVFDGRPYLVMQFCENGSCSNLAGKMNEDDIIHFLCNVSAGLEYLHANNIIHQDIKPDNILVDDNCNYQVTDFGISIATNAHIEDSDGNTSGTIAYMGPERFTGITTFASDMWSLGATVVELLTGNPPFGEHGGILQATGETLPELPNISEELKLLIYRCLDPNPDKRISAHDLHHRLQTYINTGSWYEKTNRNIIIYSVAVFVAILAIVSFFLIDYYRVKVRYYADYVEYWGVPHGINRLGKREHSHRAYSYRFEYRKGRVQRLAIVNSADVVKPVYDSEYQLMRHSDARYFYTDDGKIDYKLVYSQVGIPQIKWDYDDNLRTVTFRATDTLSTEMTLSLDATALMSKSDIKEKSQISRFLLTYDTKGLLTECRFAGYQNIPVCDVSNVFGMRYNYDDKGRVVRIDYIARNGSIKANKDGLATRLYSYDDNDNWKYTKYLNSSGGPSHDGNDCPLVQYDYDKYGNKTAESYFMLDHTPTIRADFQVHKICLYYDKKGFNYEVGYFDINDSLTCVKDDLYAGCKYKFDSRGNAVEENYFDQNRQSVVAISQGGVAITKYNFNDVDLVTKLTYFDVDGNPINSSDGYHMLTVGYDNRKNPSEFRYYTADALPVNYLGYYHRNVIKYDEFDKVLCIDYFDKDDNPALNNNGVHRELNVYNRQGAVVKYATYGIDGKLVNNITEFAYQECTYDDYGNLESVTFFDENGDCQISSYGYARVKYKYDVETNLVIEERMFDNRNNVIAVYKFEYDANGNQVKAFVLNHSGNLKSGTIVENYVYDDANRLIATYATNHKGKRVNYPELNYSMSKIKYDENGNVIENSYWSTANKPATDELKTHRRVKEYNARKQLVHEYNFGSDDKPLHGSSVYPEGAVLYDNMGNVVEWKVLDGYGKPINGPKGWHRRAVKYNHCGLLVLDEFYDTKGNFVEDEDAKYARCETSYNNQNKKIKEVYYSRKNTVHYQFAYRYNNKGQLCEQRVLNKNGQLDDDILEWFSILKIEYESNDVTPRNRKFYTASNALVGTQTYNVITQQWGKFVVSDSYNSSIDYSSNSGQNVYHENTSASWQIVLSELQNQLPYFFEGSDYSIVRVDYDDATAVFSLKSSILSKYNLSSNGDIDGFLGELTNWFRKSFGIPHDVDVIVYLFDKADRQIR